MNRKRQRREDDEEQAVERAPRATAPDVAQAGVREAAPAGPAARLLDLQARAGNAAVARLLAGGGPAVLRIALQRAPVAGAPEADAAEEPGGGKRARAYAVLEVVDTGTSMPLLSVSMATARGAGRGGGEDRTAAAHDVVATVAIEDLDPALYAAAAKGSVLDAATIVFASGMRWTLREVVVASLTAGAKTATITLSYTSIAHG